MAYIDQYGVQFSDDKKVLETCPKDFKGAYKIPDSVEKISDYAFASCSGLTSVTIPNSVTTIGEKAFYGCSGLTLVIIPNSVITIGEEAFSYCSRLTSITIPNSVTTIGERAFAWCSGLTSVIIPNSVTTIGEEAFSGCSSITLISIPNSVTTIGRWTFYACISLTYITIPNSVTTIGERAFAWCSGLTSVIIPNSVTTIGEEAFAWCESLTSISIPNSVTTIGERAFYGCSGLTSITIPNSVTTIGEEAFDNCESLKQIIVSQGQKERLIQLNALQNYADIIIVEDGETTLQDWSVEESIPLLDFARKHGRMFVGNFTNKVTGEHFTACQFGEGSNYIMVYFSEEIGTMSPSEIVEAKDNLMVRLEDNGKYYLTYKNVPIVEKEISETIIENENQSIDEQSPAYWEEIAVNDTIKPLGILTAQDLAQLQNEEYVDKVVSIVADGGTKDQTLAKLEILLGKRIKTKQMLEVEESIREFYRRLFAEALSDAKLTTESSEINNIFEHSLALQDIRDTLEMLKDTKSELSKTYQNILDLANRTGVSMNQIEREELNKI